MRTTIDIPDHLYRRLKSRAAREGESSRALILRAVDQALSGSATTAPRRVRLPLVAGKSRRRIHIDHARLYDLISFP